MLRTLVRRFCSVSGVGGKIPTLQERYLSLPIHLNPTFMQIQRRFDSGVAQVSEWKGQTLPSLVRKPDSVLVKFWWSESPFNRFEKLLMPIYDLKNNSFTGKVVELEHLIFNEPVRRDLVHRVNHWTLFYNKRTTHRTKTQAEVHGSGKKPRVQKGSGRARMGNLRASSHVGGGKSFGHKPKDFRYNVNEKVKIKALVSMMSGRLAEGRVRVYENEVLEDHKTKHLAPKLPFFGEKEKLLFVSPKTPDANFKRASSNIDRLKVVRPNEVNVRDVLTFDKVIFTVESLREFSELLMAKIFMDSKPEAVEDPRVRKLLNLDHSRVQPDYKQETLDPNSDWMPKFQILKDYYKEYKKRQTDGSLHDNVRKTSRSKEIRNQ